MITIIDIGPNALAAILAIVGFLTSCVAIWRAEKLAAMHATMQRQVTRNTDELSSVVAAQNGKE